MHSLLDDAFALVSPTSQGSTAGITLPGVGFNPGPPPASSPPSRGPRPWGPGYLPLNPYTGVRTICYAWVQRFEQIVNAKPLAHKSFYAIVNDASNCAVC